MRQGVGKGVKCDERLTGEDLIEQSDGRISFCNLQAPKMMHTI